MPGFDRKIIWDNEDLLDWTRPLKTGFKVQDGIATVAHRQDLTVSHAHNRALFAEQDRPKGKEWHLIARIEPGMAYLWKQQYGVDVMDEDHWPFVMKLLHDSQYEHVRTSPGEYRKEIKPEYVPASTPSPGRPMPISMIGKPRA